MHRFFFFISRGELFEGNLRSDYEKSFVSAKRAKSLAAGWEMGASFVRIKCKESDAF